MKSVRKLIPALALLLVSAVILSSASFAWFTMSRQVTAEGMNVTVTAPNNLLINNWIPAAGNAGAWKDNTNNDEWTEKQSTEVTGVALYPASTVDGKDFYALKDNTPANSSTGALIDASSELVKSNVKATETNGAQTGTSGSYYDFRYRIKTEGGSDVKVALTDLTIVSTATNDKTKTSVEPVRVAILANPGVEGTTTEPTTVLALYNVNNGELQEAGKAINNTKTPGVAATAVRDTVTYGTVWTAAALAAFQPTGKTQLDDDCLLFNVPAAVGTTLNCEYVTIRVWFEGEDKDCTVALASEAMFKVTAVFTAIGA